MVADLVQQGSLAVALGLLQQVDQGLFQQVITGRQRRDEQFRPQADGMLGLCPHNRCAKGLLVGLAVGRCGEGQGDRFDRVLFQATGQQLAAQHAADADQDVIGQGTGGAQAATIDQL
ncbi:hypothetical protein D3C81_1398170 [compost metagenome]